MTNRVRFFIYLLGWLIGCLGLVVPVSAQHTGEWQLEKQENWIQIYTRHLVGKRLKEVKVHCELSGSPAQLVALLSDVDNYRNVIYKTKTAWLVRRVSETDFSYYSETELPWPAKNRDLIIQMRFSYNPQTKVLQINADGQPNVVPPKPGIVRVPHWAAVWQVRPITPNRMAIDYTFQVDPGGTLPAWVVNLTATSGPYQSFEKLQTAIGLPRYQNRSYQFMTKAG